jgi:hypothetical protein
MMAFLPIIFQEKSHEGMLIQKSSSNFKFTENVQNRFKKDFVNWMHSGNISYKRVDKIFFCSDFYFLGLKQACPNQVTSGFIFMKYLLSSMKTQFHHFNFPFKFSLNL